MIPSYFLFLFICFILVSPATSSPIDKTQYPMQVHTPTSTDTGSQYKGSARVSNFSGAAICFYFDSVFVLICFVIILNQTQKQNHHHHPQMNSFQQNIFVLNDKQQML